MSISPSQLTNNIKTLASMYGGCPVNVYSNRKKMLKIKKRKHVPMNIKKLNKELDFLDKKIQEWENH